MVPRPPVGTPRVAASHAPRRGANSVCRLRLLCVLALVVGSLVGVLALLFTENNGPGGAPPARGPRRAVISVAPGKASGNPNLDSLVAEGGKRTFPPRRKRFRPYVETDAELALNNSRLLEMLVAEGVFEEVSGIQPTPVPKGRGRTVAPSASELELWARVRYTNGDLANGRLRLVPERLSRPPSSEDVARAGRESPCLRRNAASTEPHPALISVCTLVRNRPKLLVEWIQWNRLLGVSHFHIFEDDEGVQRDSVAGNTESLTQQYLSPFIAAGFVTYRLLSSVRPPFRFDPSNTSVPPASGPLLAIYGECLRLEAQRSAAPLGDGEETKKTESLLRRAEWVGIIDPDEFVVLAPPQPLQPNTAAFSLERNGLHPFCLSDFLMGASEAYELRNQGASKHEVGAVLVPWMFVGHRGELRDVPVNSGAAGGSSLLQFERTAFGDGRNDSFSTLFKPFVRVTDPRPNTQKAQEASSRLIVQDFLSAHFPVVEAPFRVVLSDGSVVQLEEVVKQKGHGLLWRDAVNLTHGFRMRVSRAALNDSTVLAFGGARLLHYYCRSFSSWLQRRMDGWADLAATVRLLHATEEFNEWRLHRYDGFTASAIGERFPQPWCNQTTGATALAAARMTAQLTATAPDGEIAPGVPVRCLVVPFFDALRRAVA